MGDLSSVSIETLASGGLLERANDCLKEVIENILDPNTDPEAKRKVKIDLTVKPHKSREFATYDISVKPVMAPATSIGGTVFVGKDGNTVRMLEKDPNQVEMNLQSTNEILSEESEVEK